MIDIGYAGALFGGVLTLLSPCSAVLLPAFFAYAFSRRTALFGRTALFYAGLVTTLVPLGIAASTAGLLLTSHRDLLIIVGSITLMTLGVFQILGISIPLPSRSHQPRRTDTASGLSIYLLGTVYGVAGVCSGPILGSVLAVAAMGSSPAYGAVLLAIYALGMALPLLVLAAAWDRFDLGHKTWLRTRPVRLGPIRTTLTSLVSGTLFVSLGALLLFTDGTSNIGGVLGIDAQYRTESVVQKWSSHIPDVGMVAALIGLTCVGLLAAWRRSRSKSAAQSSTQGAP
jgi:cytochrome c biogenesis protein CcdA